MADPVMMPDVPVPSNNAIIIFSNTGNANVEGGKIRQTISFSALTPVTVTGGVSNSFVRVTPNGNGFTVVAKGHGMSGETTFYATARSEGDPDKNLAPFTATFSFRVLVFGVDYPHVINAFHEFAVGDSVNVGLALFFASADCTLGIAIGQTPIVSQTDGHVDYIPDSNGINVPHWVGEESGLSLVGVAPGGGIAGVRSASIKGTALRPGIYALSFNMDSWDPGGTPGAEFIGGSGAGMVIINIYDDREAPRVITPYNYSPSSGFFRFVKGDVSGELASQIYGEFERADEGDAVVWVRNVSVPISAEVSEVWDYRIELIESEWRLTGRYYISDEADPGQELLFIASASGRFAGDAPPNVGWSSDLYGAGSGNYFVPSLGFFDLKGVMDVPVEDEDEPYKMAIYEQQPVVAAQYKGWDNPPALSRNDGYYLYRSPDGKWRANLAVTPAEGAEVAPQTITHAATPYTPATAGRKVEGVDYRDLAVVAPVTSTVDVPGGESAAVTRPVAINANMPTSTHPRLRMGNMTLNVPEHYTWLRQLVPPNNSGELTRQVSVSASSETYSSYRRTSGSKTRRRFQGQNMQTYDIDYVDFYMQHEQRERKGFSATVDIDAWVRSSPDVPSVAMGRLSTSALDYAKTYDSDQDEWTSIKRTYDDRPDESVLQTKRDTYNEKISSDGGGTGDGVALMVVGSGRDSTDSNAVIYSLLAAFAGGSATTSKHITRYGREVQTSVPPHDNDGDNESTDSWDEESGNVSIGASARTVVPHRAGMGLSIPRMTVTSVTASFRGGKSASTDVDVEGQSGYVHTETSTSITATHSRTSWSGASSPFTGAVGVTIVERDTDGDVTTTTYSDPSGSVYEGLYKDYGDKLSIDDIPEATGYTYGYSHRYGERQESKTTTRQSVG